MSDDVVHSDGEPPLVVREEWELTGQPNGTLGGKPFPRYRFVFGNPNEGNKEGDPKTRARAFIELCADEWTDVRLRSRIIVEHPWKDEPL